MTVSGLHSLVRQHPDAADHATITALMSVLESRAHVSQKKSLFLYREAADCLARIPVLAPDRNMGEHALAGLKQIVSTTSETRHRAAAEALGALPVSINSPVLGRQTISTPPVTDWHEIYTQCRIPKSACAKKMGRSLIFDDKPNNRILIVKTDEHRENMASLNNEANWMTYLSGQKHLFPVRFEIPEPVQMNGGYVFRVPFDRTSAADSSQKKKYGIAFWSHPDYFRYPNELEKEKQLSEDTFRSVITNSSFLLGRLCAMGIVHTAPIPLFHNRVQQQRRTDRGLYEWPRGGRLDQWLFSSRYPNFGLTGIRDFEHFTEIDNLSGRLYELMGTHMLSLVLVVGSYFRHRQPDATGLDHEGNPVDLRHLFDENLFDDLLHQIFLYYFKGFTGNAFPDALPFDTSGLTENLIDEMGVDRHMEEILRVADRLEMSDKELNFFLFQRGLTPAEIDTAKTTEEDIVMHTGPHLGRFNRRISVPLLISYLETCAALCMWGRFCRNRTASIRMWTAS